MVYSYDRRTAAKSIELSHWGLEGLARGESVTLYHGTTRSFTTFDPSKSRSELVNKFYGPGIFLVPSKRIAEKYAEANRNIGFEPSIIDEYKRKNPKGGAFLQTLYKVGHDAWELLEEEIRAAKPEWQEYPLTHAEEYLGVDPNTLNDVCPYIIGAKHQAEAPEVTLFSTSTGAPDWVYNDLDKLGLDSNVYRPKVYTVEVTVKNPLVTANKTQARGARRKRYDCVVFFGADLVGGVPEVAVFNPHDVRISRVEVV
jgi:hypothetical protein